MHSDALKFHTDALARPLHSASAVQLLDSREEHDHKAFGGGGGGEDLKKRLN